jgi:hypothetical protein
LFLKLSVIADHLRKNSPHPNVNTRSIIPVV